MDIQTLIARGALFVANHSGGKDSQCMLIELLKVVPREQLLVVHASLGEAEWPGALEHAREQAAAAGLPFLVARAVWKDGAPKSFFGLVEDRFAKRPDVPSFPSKAQRRCTSELKTGPIEREIRRYMAARGLTYVVSCDGRRAQESPDRKKLPVFAWNDKNSKGARDWYDWRPIHHLTTREVFAAIADAGQQPHPAYASGNERLSCVFCIMASKNDLAHGAREHPELFARYVELEQRTGYTMHMSRKPLAQLVAEAAALGRNGARAPSGGDAATDEPIGAIKMRHNILENFAAQEWTDADQNTALAQGWGIFDNSDHGSRVERYDIVERFASDAAANAYVGAQAILGDALAIKAITVLAQYWLED